MSTTKGTVTRASIQGIADGIRYANGSNTQYKPANMEAAVRALKKTLVPKIITENGSYDPANDNADGYSSVSVNVSSGGGGSYDWNENILCNWDFGNVVNTRGGASYSSGYGFDGWSVFQGTVRTATGGINLVKASNKDFMLSGQYLLQSNAVLALLEQTLTLSAMVDDEVGYETITITSATGNQGNTLTVNGIDFFIYRDSVAQMPVYMRSTSNEYDNKVIKAVKLEFGNTQTLAHQENGVWVLNKSQLQNEEYFRVRAMVKNS